MSPVLLIQQMCSMLFMHMQLFCLSSIWAHAWWFCWFCGYVWLSWYQPWRFHGALVQVQSPFPMIFTFYSQNWVLQYSLSSPCHLLFRCGWRVIVVLFLIVFICFQLRCLRDHDPPDSLNDLTCFTFNNLSSYNLHSMVATFSDSVKDIICPSIKPNLHNLYLVFWTIQWINLSLVWHCRKPIGILVSLYMRTCHLTFPLIRLFWWILGIGLVCKLLEGVYLACFYKTLAFMGYSSRYCSPQRLWGLAIRHSVCSTVSHGCFQ